MMTPKDNRERPLPRRVKDLRASLRQRKPEAKKQHIPDSPASPPPCETIDLTESDDESEEEMEIEIGKK